MIIAWFMYFCIKFELDRRGNLPRENLWGSTEPNDHHNFTCWKIFLPYFDHLDFVANSRRVWYDGRNISEFISNFLFLFYQQMLGNSQCFMFKCLNLSLKIRNFKFDYEILWTIAVAKSLLYSLKRTQEEKIDRSVIANTFNVIE